GIATQGDRVHCVILLSVGTPQQVAPGRTMQCHVALEFDCADLKCPRRDQYRAAAVLSASIDCGLECGGIDCHAITFGSEIANVVDAGTQITSRCSLCGLRCKSGFSQQTHNRCRGNCTCRGIFQPLPPGHQGTINFRRRWCGVHERSPGMKSSGKLPRKDAAMVLYEDTQDTKRACPVALSITKH